MRLLAAIFFLFSFIGISQTSVDSLITELNNAKEDSVKGRLELTLAKKFVYKDPEKAITYCNKAIMHFGENDKSNYAKVNLLKGLAFFGLEQYDLSLISFNKAIPVFLSESNTNDYLVAQTRVGTIYFFTSNYNSALETFFKALKIAEQSTYKAKEVRLLGNIGTVYKETNQFDKALDYFFRALEKAKKENVTDFIGSTYVNIGNVYYEKAHRNGDTINYSKALQYYNMALEEMAGSDQKSELAMLYANFANVYADKKLYNRAIELYKKAIDLRIEINDLTQLSLLYDNLSSIFIDMNKLDEALKYIELGIEAAQTTLSHTDLANLHRSHSEVDKRKGNYKLAFEHFTLHKLYTDSIFNEDNVEKRKELEMKLEYEKKETQQKAEQDKKDLIADQDKKLQRIITIVVSVGLILMIVFLVFVYNRYKLTKKQKTIIESQKQIVDHKQKEILDSIHYANRIQKSALTSDNFFKKYLRDYFVLYKPKDIVSGDFYWATIQNDIFYLATADCTGHGVPGAMMSMLGINLLNEIISERKVISPDMVLNILRKEIIRVLNPEGSHEESKDGMDIVLLALNLKTKRLQYASANNSFYIIRNNELTECKSDKMPVGKSPKDTNDFTLHNIALHENDLIITITDGYADQFGGKKGKKFMYKQLQALLVSNCELALEKQKGELNKSFENWKGDQEQVDDVCIIGIRV